MKNTGLAARLSALIGGSAVAVAALIGVTGAVVGSGILRGSVTDNLRRLATDYANIVGLYVVGARSVLETTAPAVMESGAVTAPTAERLSVVHGMARQILAVSPAFEYLMLVDSRGKVLAIEPADLAGSLSRSDVAFADWFDEVTTAKATGVSDLWISTATQSPSVVIAVPLLGKGNTVLGMWAGGLRLGALSQIAAPSTRAVQPGASGFVTDSRGLIVADQTRPQFVLGQTDFHTHPMVRQALKGASGSMQYISPIDGVEKLGAYLPLPVGNASGRDWTVSYGIPSAVALQPVRVLAWMLALISFALGVGTAAMGAVIVRRTLRPVSMLALAARAMGNGDLAARAPAGMRYELAGLSDAFNQMASSLAASQEILNQRATLLEQSNQRLEVANSELEAFSYSVSHDLRAPLRSIDGFSRAVLEDYAALLDDEGKDYLRILRESAQKMGTLIDDMLKLSRVTRGEMSRESVDLSSIARVITGELSGLAPGRRAEFVIQDGLTAVGDPGLLESALRNLLENAWKFTRDREMTRVEFGLRSDNGEACFFIRDNGVGMDMNYASKLFQPFRRMHASAEFEGTGIGLATVKRILARHGGKVWAESEVGTGTTFYFTV